MQFNPSGIAVHPHFPEHLYIVATSGQLLVVVDKVRKRESVEKISLFNCCKTCTRFRREFSVPCISHDSPSFSPRLLNCVCSVCLSTFILTQKGITFSKDGTLYICNEGRGKEGGPGIGSVQKFEMQMNLVLNILK
jgi:hypothetical protein